ncbi:MAG: hypothetical protein WAS73_02740, partial [Defluviicoccus sp.]
MRDFLACPDALSPLCVRAQAHILDDDQVRLDDDYGWARSGAKSDERCGSGTVRARVLRGLIGAVLAAGQPVRFGLIAKRKRVVDPGFEIGTQVLNDRQFLFFEMEHHLRNQRAGGAAERLPAWGGRALLEDLTRHDLQALNHGRHLGMFGGEKR